MKRPRQFRVTEGRICEAGQHDNCPGVGDPYDDAEDDVFICSCACHYPPFPALPNTEFSDETWRIAFPPEPTTPPEGK